ncbi:hypothetical protein [Nostoc sp.]|uniref:hypothetical protein n=1 Tax=Nostoc sp. TaxID=1180 RepID=UPI002FFA3385
MNNFSWILLITKRVLFSLVVCFLITIVFLGSGDASASGLRTASDGSDDIYPTRTVHNETCQESENFDDNCLAKRKEGEPTDPQYPKWWISDWRMYRVFQDYKKDKFRPPYTSPPENLTPSDYEVSYGTTYYDSTYIPKDQKDGTGAMMEYYQDRCLPIFPRSNKYTCAFVSLGNKAYFLNYGQEPNQKPRICLFSPHNHPPRTDFIKHLPYQPKQSTHLNNSLQAYSMFLPKDKLEILFGYAFYKNPTPDSFDKTAKPYRHPQSFYFSGNPNEAKAPLVSQNYTNFRMEQPDSKIWSKIAKMLPEQPKECCLYQQGCPD